MVPARPPRSGSSSACSAADGGELNLLGGDPWHDAVELHHRLAYVPGDVNLWPNLTGGETIELLGIKLHDRIEAIHASIERVGKRGSFRGS